MPFEKKRKLEEEGRKKRHIAYTPQGICDNLFEIVRNKKIPDGSFLCNAFISLPIRRDNPDQDAGVTTPMDLSKVEERLKVRGYAGVDHMQEDFNLVINNALAYYPEDSKEASQAKELDQLFKQSRRQLTSQAAEANSGDSKLSEKKDSNEVVKKEDIMEVDADDDEAASKDLSNNNKTNNNNATLNDYNTSNNNNNSTPIQQSSSSLPDQANKISGAENGSDDGLTNQVATTSTTIPATHSNSSSTNNSPIKAKIENKESGACMDESSRSGFSNTVTSGSEMDDESRLNKGLGEQVPEMRKKRKGRRRTNKEIFQAKMKEMGVKAEEEDTDQTTEEEESVMVEQLFSATLMSPDGLHPFTELFKIIPSKLKCPVYHQVVKEPMDLRMIARKIQASHYATVDDMIKEFMLIVANAKSYNEPHSRIYKEANSMKKHLLNKRQELEQRKQMRSQRTRVRTQYQTVGNMSSVFAALKTESEDERAGSDGEFSESGHSGNEQWVLFNAVNSYKDPSDVLLSEPFLRLPSKRFYPDYFQEIKKPMSLMKIQKKIKSSSYISLEMLTKDFELVFENAMQYNREDSRIYKDAESLLGFVRVKVEEIVKEKSLNESLEEERRKRPRLSDEALKRNLWSLYRAVFEHQVDDRTLIDIFVRLPSKREYPDYYEVITRPIDMTTIEYKIKNDRYTEMQGMVDDLKLMFKNARLFNKEMSQVHNDATVLDKVVNTAHQAYLEQLDTATKCLPKSIPKIIPAPLEVKKLLPVDKNSAFTRACLQHQQELYGLVRHHKDASGKVLSAPFINLPLKTEYPDYYETISKPMDLTRVYQRIVSGGYLLLDDIFTDLSLIFTNACLYNEPESQIYKDAVCLQRVCNERKVQWNEQAMSDVPVVDGILQVLLKQLLTALVTHKDSNGRVYSNSFHELNLDFAGHSYQNKPKKTLEYIRREVEMGLYKRLDSLQENLLSFFQHAICNYKHDQQLVEDSVELMKMMITKRDQLCGVYADQTSSSSSSPSKPPPSSSSPLNLHSLSSPALSYDITKLQQFLKENGVDIKNEDEEDDGDDDDGQKGGASCDSVQCNGQVYSAGDFVYIKSCSKIVEIRRLWRGGEGGCEWLRGVVYVPPQLTKHHPSRTFLQKEVLKSTQQESFPTDVVGGRCLVLSVSLYALHLPSPGDVIAEKDVYVCESRYDVQTNVFRVLKNWKGHSKTCYSTRDAAINLLRSHLNLTNPTLPTPPNVTVDRQRVIVQLVRVNASDPNTYYEQICTPNNMWIKIGDCVMLKAASVGDKARILKVDKIWTTNRGESNISGPLLLYPTDLTLHQANRSFYRKELLLSNKEVTQSYSNLAQTCVVMGVVDYCTRRLLGCREEWVFVCDLKYNEADKSLKKNLMSIKQAGLSDQVCADEVLSLKKPIIIAREQLETPVARTESAVMLAGEEESMDFFPSTETSSAHDSASFISESFSGGNIAVANNSVSSSVSNTVVPGSSTNGGGASKEDVTASVKKRKKRSATSKVRNVTGYIVYAGECRKNIQAEFPDLNFGDISRAVGTRWKSLPRELKEKYEEKARQLTQEVGREVLASPAPDSRSMSPASLVNAIHSKATTTTAKTIQTQQQQLQQQQLQQQHTILPTIDLSTNQNTTTKFNHGPPLFVDVPPQTYKVVHSEAYIRYIHGLAQGNKFIGDFNKSLWAKKPSTMSVEATKLPSHWLANGPGHHGDVVSAFWALRQHMLNDALRIDQVLN